tara:strand:+ start:16084 stop:17571 length:1488 start_codon:yes stop_codon:yes gene_type:complete
LEIGELNQKRTLILFLAMSLSHLVVAQKLQALFSSNLFQAPGQGPYVETYLLINGFSANYAKIGEGKFQAKIEVTYAIKKGESIIQFDKIAILSPIVSDTIKEKPNFLDQQRFIIPNGDYVLSLKMDDLNADDKPIISESELNVDFKTSEVQFSQIELVDNYTKSSETSILSKSGFTVVPFLSTFYPETKTKLKFYAEVYGTDSLLQDDLFLVKYYIAKRENTQILNAYVGYMRQKTAPVNVILREFNIEKLKSGNYDLIIEARDRNNNLLAHKSLFFQRSNVTADNAAMDYSSIQTASTFVDNINTLDSIREFTASLRPIADESERRFIDSYTQEEVDTSLDVMKRFFYAFWSQKNDLNPEKEWEEYWQNVKAVDIEFGTRIRKGYNTDRGRTYLRYGKPNSRVEVPNEPNSYPYEIWHYFQIKNQTNGKFVFWSKDNVTNDYEVLHSTIFTEVNNPRWEMMLQQRNTPQFDLDQVDPGYSIGSRAKEYWDTPR